MRKAYTLLNTICSHEDDKLVIKFYYALEKQNITDGLRDSDYCNNDSTENYDV